MIDEAILLKILWKITIRRCFALIFLILVIYTKENGNLKVMIPWNGSFDILNTCGNYIYIYIYIYIPKLKSLVFVHKSMSIYMCVWVCVRVRVYTYIYIYMYVCVCVCVSKSNQEKLPTIMRCLLEQHT